MKTMTSTVALLCTATAAFADGHITTIESGDEFRAALEAAATGGPSTIVIAGGDIQGQDSFTYAGTAPLTIIGAGQTIAMETNADVFAVSNGADLSMSNLTLAGPGGFSIENRGDLGDQTAGKGLFVDLRDDQTGTINVTLNNITVRDVANHGIHVSDCTLADECGGGSGGAGEGSAAGINLTLHAVTVDNAGNGKFDADGLRVDERGEGSITVAISGSTFTRVGADGVELDEGQAGDVISNVFATTFSANGNYCDPALMDAYLPTPNEGEFEEGAFAEADVPPAVTGSLDDSCIEREVGLYDDGSVEEFAFGLDLDDGYDIDEAGPGGILSIMSGSAVIGNLDEGIDFDEEGAGNIDATFIATNADDNRDDGFKLSEEGDGAVIGFVSSSAAIGNGGKGIVFEEADAGDLTLQITATATSGNDDGDDTGVEAVQEDNGMGALMISSSDIADGTDLDGVDLK